MSKEKLPAIQMYPGDWMRDSGVRASSLQARGLWIEMIWLMTQGEPYGHLTINGKKMDEKTLSRLVGAEMKRTCASLAELGKNGVYSLTKDGIIYSRRMVKDAYLRAIRSEAGSKGGKVTTGVLPRDLLKQNTEQTPPPSSSSSVSTPNTLPKKLFLAPPQNVFSELLTAYNRHRNALPEAKSLTKGRQKIMIARWNERPDIAYWTEIFKKAGRSKTMAKWASFNWLLENSENHVKVFEGNYDNARDASGPPVLPRYIPPPIPPEDDIPDEKFINEFNETSGFARRRPTAPVKTG